MTAIAFLGLGAMSSRIARRLADAGHDLTVWNRDPAKGQDLVARGALRAESPRVAVQGGEPPGRGPGRRHRRFDGT
jgi:3-hydroxyisobutyrate dehydrogenase-like beta-hydroxyacid dehydrogenase